MHIVMAILSVVGAGVFWWYRLNAAGAAVRDLTDMAGRAHGNAKRRRFRARAAESPFAAIDDPVVAAATAIIAIADDAGGFDAAAEARLRSALRPVAASGALVDEAVIYGKWAAGQTAEASTALRHVAPLLVQTLTPEERGHLLAIAREVLEAGAGTPGRQQHLLRALENGLKI